MAITGEQIVNYAGNMVGFLQWEGITDKDQLKRYYAASVNLNYRSESLHIGETGTILKSPTILYFVSGIGIPLEVSFGSSASSPRITLRSSSLFDGYTKRGEDSHRNITQTRQLSRNGFREVINGLERLSVEGLSDIFN
ncbi:hypothetical protein HY212_05265 [Candidatus Pacearchaeota archaeon]|nr:hypothetical protein [Candidatus Pacearchaeota archaeon]